MRALPPLSLLSLLPLLSLFLVGCLGDLQLDALNQFANETGVQNWKKNQGWGTNADPCGRNKGDAPWFGLTCSGGWVTAIQLSGNALGGTLPASIANVPYLETLDLSDNMLIGTIPNNLDNLSSLVYVALNNNHFRGHLPNLGANNTGYTSLYFGMNQLQGPIPDSFLNIQALQQLDLSKNSLSGTVPDGLASLSLQSLWIDYNDFSGQMPLNLCQSLLICSAGFNTHLMCPSMSCTCGDMLSCNCNGLCQNDSDCANGLCTSCVGASLHLQRPLPNRLGVRDWFVYFLRGCFPRYERLLPVFKVIKFFFL